MRKITLSICALLYGIAFSQTLDYKKAPNSFIYDIALAKTNNYGGILIPVIKAYEMWNAYPYLKTNGVATPIPTGVQTASLLWEDVPGLISSVDIVPGTTPQNSKIKANINKGLGSGNAVVALKVDGVTYWSWHIWVTENPTNGVSYKQGFETDASLVATNIQYMDRNLGAQSKNIVGKDWQKSGGMLYEWGRKDPFPPLAYKDSYFYELNGESGSLKHKSIDAVNTIPVKIREFNDIERNIQFSVKNPYTYIINTDATGNWFSNQRYRVAATSTTTYTTWDLWGDNTKGKDSNANSSNTTLKNDSRSYELKSELDPCPNGWRVPSYYGRVTQNNNLAFFGRKANWNNDDITNDSKLFPTTNNLVLSGIKVYPGLGMDFTNAQSGSRNIGLIPNAGSYVYYPNSVSPNAPVGIIFQDQNASTGIWSATYGGDGGRLFSAVSDPGRTNTTVGLHAIYNNQTNPTRTGNSVRCIKDPNLAKIGNFATEYFASSKENYSTGLDQPNSFNVFGLNYLEIPVNKPFAVYNQILTEQESLPAGNLKAKVLWTTNTNLIKDVTVNINSTDYRNSLIAININPNEFGNAVISLHNDDTNSPALWSWHIWSPKSNPNLNMITYTTENVIPTQFHFVDPTKSMVPRLTTTFMDRNLGALDVMPTASNIAQSKSAQGLHYQWGRKDPIPTFAKNELGNDTQIYLGKNNAANPILMDYELLDKNNYQNTYTTDYTNYVQNFGSKFRKVRSNLLYSIQHPLQFMYHNSIGALYDGGNAANNDLTKVKDWVLDERNQAAERWGHGTQKSVFDPCPQGWRVPDVSATNLYTGSKGNSPWYNGYVNDAYGKPGVIQNQWHNISTYYQGTVIANEGWVLNGANYKIGNYPMDGIRGEIGGNDISYARSGVWTASLADRGTGYALAMQFQADKMQTGTGVYPQAGMGVRCARDFTVALGTNKTATSKIAVPQKQSNIGLDIEISPNPFVDLIKINNNNVKSVEVYDVGGNRISALTVKDSTIDLGNLSKGIYVLKLYTDEGNFTKKIIKK